MNAALPLADDLVGYLASGLSITVATRDDQLRPDGDRGWAVLVHSDRAHLTVFLLEEAAPPHLRNLAAHPEIAIAFDRPTDNRACQIKGRVIGTRPAREDERAEVERQANGFRDELVALGIPRTMTDGWRTWPAVALDVAISEVYEQTPGPGAGEPMR